MYIATIVVTRWFGWLPPMGATRTVEQRLVDPESFGFNLALDGAERIGPATWVSTRWVDTPEGDQESTVATLEAPPAVLAKVTRFTG